MTFWECLIEFRCLSNAHKNLCQIIGKKGKQESMYFILLWDEEEANGMV
jgi:hypothetical protein